MFFSSPLDASLKADFGAADGAGIDDRSLK